MSLRLIPTPTAINALTAILAQRDRRCLERLIASAIEALDQIDGDPDYEASGDDEDGDADGDRRDVAWPEWSARPPGRLFVRDREMDRTAGPGVLEDDEDGHDKEHDDAV